MKIGARKPKNSQFSIEVKMPINAINNTELSKEAQEKLTELIEKYDPINNKTFKSGENGLKGPNARDSRLPIPGTVITRKYKGNLIEVKVLEEGFEFEGKLCRSLTNIARKITGSVWNGFNFFNL